MSHVFVGRNHTIDEKNKYEVKVFLTFELEAFDSGDAIAIVEALKLHEKIGNVRSYDYKQTVVKKL